MTDNNHPITPPPELVERLQDLEPLDAIERAYRAGADWELGKMMTGEQILELVKEHFKEGGIQDDGSCSEYYGEIDAFVKFAQLMYEEGYDQGCFEATGGQ